MVQIIKGGPSRSSLIADLLGPSLGEGLGNFAGNYFANKALDKVKNDPELENAPQSERMSKLEAALRPYGQRGMNMLQSQLGIEQERKQEQSNEALSNIQSSFAEDKPLNPKDLKKLDPQTQLKVLGFQKRKNQGNQIYNSLIKAGYPEETAALYKNQIEAASEGGITDTMKVVNDLLRRSKTGKGQFAEEEKPQLKPTIEIPGIETESFELDFPELKSSVGRSSADLVKEESENRKINAPLYGETIDSLNALEEDFRDFKQLQEYNMTPGALPTGGEKWNVDWDTGDLKFAALANAETQDYVKIIARLLGRAKEYFPGRVTNFDLAQFSKRFPRLANSPEGRELITKQLMTANRIAYLKDETLKAAIDHYGAEGDPTQIRKYANENYRRLKSTLESELKDLNASATQMDKESQQENKSEKPGFIKMKDPQGIERWIPEDVAKTMQGG